MLRYNIDMNIQKQRPQSLFPLNMRLKSFFAIVAFLVLPESVVFGLEKSMLIGNYELQGVMEVAGVLQLNNDQKYLAQFIYGAAEWIEEGRWKIEGDEVVLKESRIQKQNMPIPSPFLRAGTKFKYEDGKLTASESDRKIVFLDPNKTPSIGQMGEPQCRPYKEPSLMLGEGSLLSVGETEVVISDLMLHLDFVVKRAWADKNIPALLSPPKLYKLVQKEIPGSDIICARPIISGEGRMRVRGRVVKIDSESLVVEMGECFEFAAGSLPESVRKAAREKKGESIDVEIPYSAMISSGGCLH